MSDDLVLRAAGPDDDEGIRALFVSSFPDSPKVAPDFLRWQYWDTPFSETRSWVWEDGGEIVSHYAGLPVPAVVRSHAAVAAIGVDAATAPSHRGRGLFESLAREVYLDCGRHGIPVTMCFPNASSLRGFIKAGGTPVAQLQTWVLPIDDEWVAARFGLPKVVARGVRRAGFRGVGRVRGHEVDQPPPDLDELWQSLRPAVHYGIARHARWWEGRYVMRPGSSYRFFEVREGSRLSGVAATLLRDAFGGRFVCILELLAGDRESAAALVRAIAA